MKAFRVVIQALVALAMIAGVFTSVAKAQTLPSNNYDDYDREKYENILRHQEDLLERARRDLRDAEARLNQAQRREADADRDLRRATENLRTLQAREIEINKKIQDNVRAQGELTKRIADSDRDLKLLQQQVEQNTQSQERMKSIITGLREESNRQEAIIRDLRQKDQEAQRASAEAQRAHAQLEQRIAKLNDDLGKATSDEDKAKIQTALNAALAEMPNVLSVRNQTKAAADAARAALEAAQPAAQQAKQRLDAAEAELNQAVANGNSLRQLRDRKQNELNEQQRALSANQSETTQLNQNLVQVRQNIENSKREIDRAERDYRQFVQMTRQAQYERDAAAGVLTAKMRDRENAVRYLEWVDNNIAQARVAIGNQGNSDGSADGDREGRELGEQRGSRDGQAAGQRDGHERGTADGRQRDYDDGARKGSAVATTDATAKATADAEVAGKRNGEADGTRDGLAASYAQGKKDGLAHGDATGSDQVAYKKGRVAGEADGLARAVRDAAYREGEGYTDRENMYLNANLKDVVVGDASKSQKFKGLQGRYADSGEDRYYRPRPASYPHPRLQRFYMEAYDAAYRSVLESVYAETYRSVYRITYDNNYRDSYQRAFALDYNDSREQGYKDAYRETYRIVYERVYAAEYRVRYQRYYQALYDANKNDKPQYDKGFADGNAIASEAKGFREGTAAAYKANIDIEKDKAYKAGIARADELYTKNPVLKLVDIKMRDMDADGVFRPGEEVLVVANVKNFGLVAKTDLVSEFLGANGISITQSKAQIPALPGQSNIQIIGTAQAVLADAKEGSAFQLEIKLVDSKGKVLGLQAFNARAQYPAQVTISGFDGILIPGVATTVKLVVKNRSQSAQNLILNLAVDASRVSANRTQISVADLKAGASTEVSYVLTGKPEARFEESPLQIVTTQNNLTFAVDQAMKMTIISRHKATTDSKGLIISGNLARGGGKALFKADKFDTWDLRVDGSISSVDRIASYSNRVVHVLADTGVTLDAATAASLVALVKSKSGGLIVWGADLDQTQVVNQLNEVLNAKLSREVTVNGTVTGRTALTGVSLKIKGAAAVLSGASRKSRTVLESSSGALGVSSFVNGLADKTGWTLTLGLDLNTVDAAGIKSIMTAFARERMSFGEKLEAAAKSPASLMRVAVTEALNEMIQIDLNGTMRYYKDTDKKTKLYRMLDRLIGKQKKGDAVRVELGKYYPTARDTFNSIRSSDEKWHGEHLILAGFGGFFATQNWRDLYCADKGWNSDKYCSHDTGNGF